MADLIAELEDELSRCNKCGFCMSACPTYQVSGLEWLVTRGRVSLLQDAAGGALERSELAASVDSCLLCNACVAACPPQIDITRLIRGARADALQHQGMGLLQRLLLRGVLAHPTLLRLGACAGRLTEPVARKLLGASRLSRRPLIARSLQVAPSFGPDPRRLLRPWLRRLPAPKARVAYLVSCVKTAFYGRAAAATCRVLYANNVQVIAPNLPCCGLVSANSGDLEGARDLARRQLRLLSNLPVDCIVSDDASCAAHLTRLGELFPEGAERAACRALAGKVQEFATFLSGVGMRPLRELRARVTWHDPCHLRHHLKQADAPRRLLRQIPGLAFVEAQLGDMCCGGAGSYMVSQPELSDQVGAVKLDALLKTDAEYIVTGSPACVIQLNRLLREAGASQQVLYLSELLNLVT